MKRALAALFVVTALGTGGREWYLMMRQLLGAPTSLWYPVVLGASIVLLIGGAMILFPWVNAGLGVAAAALCPLVLCLWLGFSWRCVAFALTTAVFTWVCLRVAREFNRPSIVPLVASVVLALWWIPAFVYSAVSMATAASRPDIWELLLTLVLVALVIGCVVAAVALLRAPALE